MSVQDPSEYSSAQGVSNYARFGLLFASLAITAAVLVFAIAE
jgi:hypothetical protein